MDALRALLAPNPSPMTLDGTRTFLVGHRRPVVIDPGPNDPGHLRAILAALDGATPVALLLTHHHPDHAGAAEALAQATGVAARVAADGERVETDAGSIEAVATPGHSPDHTAYLWVGGDAPAGGALFVGDLFMGVGDTTLVAPPEGKLADYLRSLARVEALAPGVLHPAHGPPITDAAEAVARYREHRLARIEQVNEALEREPGASPERLVETVYGMELHPELRDAAAGSVRAILEYLRGTYIERRQLRITDYELPRPSRTDGRGNS